MFETDCILVTLDPLKQTTSNTDSCPDEKHDNEVKKEGMICLKSDGECLRVIKNSYDTSISTVLS